MSSNFGWSYDQEKILAAESRMSDAGYQVSFSADRPSLSGYWKRRQSAGVHIVAAQQDEMALNGTWRDPNSQRRGTCVGQGSSRAIEDVHNSRLVDGEIVGVYTQIAYEPMYGFERHQRWSQTHPWGCNCGNCPDGLQGADAAAFYTTQGVVRRANYVEVGTDLSSPHEELAITWNNSGVPNLLVAAAAFHKVVCHSSNSWDEYADAIAAKMWGHICLPQCFGLARVIVGPYGTVEPDSAGGHDTECCGVVTLPSGETGFLIQQSWGINGPKYPPVVQTASGPLTLRPGSYCVRQSVLEGIGPQVERISCDIPSGSSFR
jgi:hypothetical protein